MLFENLLLSIPNKLNKEANKEQGLLPENISCRNLIDGKETECYFGDLMPRVMKYKESQSYEYKTGKVYRWRDGAEGGIDND